MKLSLLSSWAAVLSPFLITSVLADNTTVPSVSLSANKGQPDEVFLGVNVPEGQEKTDLYFSFSAPANGHAWVGFGIGSSMSNSLMFVVYRSENNQGEPVVSPRTTTGHAMPQHETAVNITVMPGSNVTADRFTANIHCLNCRTWGSSSKIDITSTTQPFFYALGPDGDLKSNDQDASIGQHDSTPVPTQLDVTKAVGVAGVPIQGASSDSSSNSGSGNDDGVTYIQISRGAAIHGFLMCFAFAIVFPGGYLFLRLFEKVWLHWGIQSLGLLITLLGIGLGIAVSIKDNTSPKLTHPHQVIGLIILILCLTTWTLGLVGHTMYRRHGVPSPFMKVHRIFGPTTIFLGFVDACIGLAWIGLSRAIIGYTMFNLLVAVVIGSLVFLKRRRTLRKQAMESTAAQNFREGHQFGHGGPPPPAYGQAVPMQTFGQQPQPHQQGQNVEYYSVQPK